ncbi:Cyclin-dependent kinase 10 [Dimargaris verticillata]|uniref:Cyclin-dependent kinase 10 n=1 Tax=Dimargaris verticillata TaxID=2761393 RepID=A0A9W8B154_9FUNG|nr:Cyclin-dependent kinase 10 [Dimargaris verticillata]
MHSDLKLSNLLVTAQGTLKIADFGLGRIYATPSERMTPRVVTLWYRAPELLLGDKRYTPAVDMWSVGCIFGEFLLHQPCLPGTSELQQLERIVDLLGTPRERIWPGIRNLPLYRSMALPKQPYNNVRVRFANASPGAHQLLNALFTYDPNERVTAGQALAHGYFQEAPPAPAV